jgi:hypothetical protein
LQSGSWPIVLVTGSGFIAATFQARLTCHLSTESSPFLSTDASGTDTKVAALRILQNLMLNSECETSDSDSLGKKLKDILGSDGC